MIKIRGGKYLHRQLKQPPLEITRSTKDVCKEGMFNSLGNIFNYSFLDLFGGSGSIGIEAYSRGANPVYINLSGRLLFCITFILLIKWRLTMSSLIIFYLLIY